MLFAYDIYFVAFKMEVDVVAFIVSGIINLVLIFFTLKISDQSSEEKLILLNMCKTQCFLTLSTFSSLILDGYADAGKLTELFHQVKRVIETTFILELGISLVIFTIYYFCCVVISDNVDRSTIKKMLVFSWLFSIVLGISNYIFIDMSLPPFFVFTIVGIQITMMVIVLFCRMVIKLTSSNMLHIHEDVK